MHEVMAAQGVLSAIIAEAEKQKARPVAARISCGMLNAINDEAFSFAFEAISKGTVCEDVKVTVEHKAIQGRCRGCKAIFEFEIHKPGCPKCGADNFELLPDAPLLLEEIEFETG